MKFGPLPLGDGALEDRVPLEHLITCIPSVTIVTAQNGFKVIKWISNKPPGPNLGKKDIKSLFKTQTQFMGPWIHQPVTLRRALASALQESRW